METNLPTSFNPENYILEPGTHHDKRVIWISFHFNQELKEQLKSSCKAHWSRTGKKWYVVDNLHHRKLLGMEPNYYGKAAFLEVAPINQPALQRMVEQLQLRGYSPNTVRTYATEFVQLLKILKDYPVHELSPEKLRSYFLYCINRLKLSENLIHSRMNAVKFYFEQVLHRERMFLEIPRPKKPSLLPKAISATDIKKMLATIENPKHLLLLKLCYGMGLRVSEIVNMKITDIDTKTMQVLVNQSKGKKDRYVGLPESVLHELRSYYAVYKPKKYLFEGQSRGQYSVRSVQSVFKKAMKEAKINKTVGIHSLRHSYATHLIEQGTDIRFVQELLGHNSIKTTMIYTNLTDQAKRQIKSPLDRL